MSSCNGASLEASRTWDGFWLAKAAVEMMLSFQDGRIQGADELMTCPQSNSGTDAIQHYNAIYAAAQQANDDLHSGSHPAEYETAMPPQAGNMSALSDNRTLSH